MDILIIENIVKKFENNLILKGISINIREGEFLTLLGPSGCGKTTTLRIIAGLEYADSGRIILSNEDVTNKEPNLRNVNTVFQNYALFPHMNVFDNIAYPLKIRKVNKGEIKSKVLKILELVKLNGYEKRKIPTLSGGEKQRVAIARALINEPKVLLLDEPLGALDLKLRRYMQTELKRLQKQLGITFIYVTHDQDEALNMSDRIAVMNNGRIEQIGLPQEIYNNPLTKFTAKFIGERNIFEAQFITKDNNNFIKLFNIYIPVKGNNNFKNNGEVFCSILQDKIKVNYTKKSEYDIKGKIIEKHYTGSQIIMTILPYDDKSDENNKNENNKTKLKAISYSNEYNFSEGEEIFFSWDMNDCTIIGKKEE